MDTNSVSILLDETISGGVMGKKTESAVLGIIFQNPICFGFGGMDEDDRSAFLIEIAKVLPKILASFDPSRGNLLSYLYIMTRLTRKSWRRYMAKSRASSDTLDYCFRCEHGFDEALFVAEDDPAYDVEAKGLHAHPSSLSPDMKELVHVLILKNAYYFSDVHIGKAAQISGISKKTLTSQLDIIREEIQGKVDRFDREVQNRNRAFFLKSRYKIELDRLNPLCSHYTDTERRFRYQSVILERKNECIKSMGRITPTDVFLGELLNIKARRVTRILARAKRIRIDQIFSNKKHGQTGSSGKFPEGEKE
jgi:hypothetical protein